MALQEVKQENIAALDETGLARCVESIENFKELSLNWKRVSKRNKLHLLSSGKGWIWK